MSSGPGAKVTRGCVERSGPGDRVARGGRALETEWRDEFGPWGQGHAWLRGEGRVARGGWSLGAGRHSVIGPWKQGQREGPPQIGP